MRGTICGTAEETQALVREAKKRVSKLATFLKMLIFLFFTLQLASAKQGEPVVKILILTDTFTSHLLHFGGAEGRGQDAAHPLPCVISQEEQAVRHRLAGNNKFLRRHTQVGRQKT